MGFKPENRVHGGSAGSGSVKRWCEELGFPHLPSGGRPRILLCPQARVVLFVSSPTLNPLQDLAEGRWRVYDAGSYLVRLLREPKPNEEVRRFRERVYARREQALEQARKELPARQRRVRSLANMTTAKQESDAPFLIAWAYTSLESYRVAELAIDIMNRAVASLDHVKSDIRDSAELIHLLDSTRAKVLDRVNRFSNPTSDDPTAPMPGDVGAALTEYIRSNAQRICQLSAEKLIKELRRVVLYKASEVERSLNARGLVLARLPLDGPLHQASNDGRLDFGAHVARVLISRSDRMGYGMAGPDWHAARRNAKKILRRL